MNDDTPVPGCERPSEAQWSVPFELAAVGQARVFLLWLPSE